MGLRRSTITAIAVLAASAIGAPTDAAVVTSFAPTDGQPYGLATGQSKDPKTADEGCSRLILPCIDEPVFIGTKVTINTDRPAGADPSVYDLWVCRGDKQYSLLTPADCTFGGNGSNGYVVKEADLGKQVVATRDCKSGTFENVNPSYSTCVYGGESLQIYDSPPAPTMPVIERLWTTLPATFSVPSAIRPSAGQDPDELERGVYYYMKVNGKVRASCRDKAREPGVFLACPPSNSTFIPSKKDGGKMAVIEACSVNRLGEDDKPDPYFLESRSCVSTKAIKIEKTKTYRDGLLNPPKDWRPLRNPGITLSLGGSKVANAEMDYAGINVALISNRPAEATVTVKLDARTSASYGLKRAETIVGTWTTSLTANANPVGKYIKAPSAISKSVRRAIINRDRNDAVPVKVSVDVR